MTEKGESFPSSLPSLPGLAPLWKACRAVHLSTWRVALLLVPASASQQAPLGSLLRGLEKNSIMEGNPQPWARGLPRPGDFPGVRQDFICSLVLWLSLPLEGDLGGMLAPAGSGGGTPMPLSWLSYICKLVLRYAQHLLV